MADTHEQGLKHLHKTADDAKISELPVKEFMGPVEVQISQKTQIYTAIQTLAAHNITGAPVVDAGGHLVGMVSEYDLLLQAATKDLTAPMEFTADRGAGYSMTCRFA